MPRPAKVHGPRAARANRELRGPESLIRRDSLPSDAAGSGEGRGTAAPPSLRPAEQDREQAGQRVHVWTCLRQGRGAECRRQALIARPPLWELPQSGRPGSARDPRFEAEAQWPVWCYAATRYAKPCVRGPVDRRKQEMRRLRD
ncbi:hypothetical protein AAFF_G00202300 [Aldrovandia affinis]|uniref:Uncharacterized protein n=1 Tax=Aldrovandia affinis TaxID=143900 RepID=A0AAD7WVY5_9TELE|nr:hypothetical protein AAFF_G00202300 [Aldrovandia affinis]